jgi:hypothetical protein
MRRKIKNEIQNHHNDFNRFYYKENESAETPGFSEQQFKTHRIRETIGVHCEHHTEHA